MGRGLSPLQQAILVVAWHRHQEGREKLYDTGSVTFHKDVLKQVYGWQVKRGRWNEWFTPQAIGMAAYQVAAVSVSRAITRLCDRGLLQQGRSRGEVTLTPSGARQAQDLLAKIPADNSNG